MIKCGKENTRVETLCLLATNTLFQWSKAQDKFEVPLAAFLTEKDGAEKWMKPSMGKVKINVDAAIFPDQGRFSFACIARNDQGVVIEAITSCKQGTPTPELVEAMSVKEALSWIKAKAWQQVTIET